jgi:hypothetical protein
MYIQQWNNSAVYVIPKASFPDLHVDISYMHVLWRAKLLGSVAPLL